MITWFNKRKELTKFLICMTLTFMCLFLIRLIFSNYYLSNIAVNENSTYEKREIIDETDYYKINVSYPKFNNTKINKIISNYVFNYVKEFKKNAKENAVLMNTLNMDYTISFIEDYLNIFFKIENSLDINNNTESILIDLNEFSESNITDIYEEDVLTSKIRNTIIKKYPSFISSKIINTDINKFDYEINNDFITIYFDKDLFDRNISYLPYINISLVEDVFFEDYKIEEDKKLIAFTFDDGPSEHTFDLLQTLRLNNSKGTFFMLGNRMKYLKQVVQEIYLSGNEIGSHSYSHKNLTRITKGELLSEINSVTIIYNEITGDNLKYLRPPYGNVNERLRETSVFPLIKWSIDPTDWLSRNPEEVAAHILEKAYDGAIVLLHDLYPETIEAVKMTIPELQSRGYELVTISDLAKYKNYSLAPGQIVREMR